MMERIGEYKVRRLIGEGGMGKVYEAEEQLSGRRVALKVLRPELVNDEESRARFLGEMKILATLEHPGIVRSLASFEEDGRFVMVLEHLDGESLRQTLEAQGKVDPVSALRIARGIAAALGAAHGQSPAVVHRDLKPDNVMMLDDGRVKVMDFGIARVLEGLPHTTRSVGTLQYMSPEQIDAQPTTPASDLYSLGLVIYELLSGSPPFSSASPRELLNLQCTAAPPELPADVQATMPDGAMTLLSRLLAKDPAARPASAMEVVRRLDELIPGPSRELATVTTLPARLAPDAPLAKPGHDVWRTLAIGLICFVLGSVVLFMTDPMPKPEPPKPDAAKASPPPVKNTPARPAPTLKLKPQGALHITPDAARALQIAGRSSHDALASFYIDETEISVRSFRQCVASGACEEAQFTSFSGSNASCNYDHIERTDHPMNCISPQGAQQFCEWRGLADEALTWQLPSGEQWEKAARGPQRLNFPWGDQPADCNTSQLGACNHVHTAAVGTFDRDLSPFQLRDVVGNVSEWVLDARSGGRVDQTTVAVRGGSWRTPPASLRSLSHPPTSPRGQASDEVGFRCVGM